MTNKRNEKIFLLGVGAQKAGTSWLHEQLHQRRDADFGFCGCRTEVGLPYCVEHGQIAYQTTTRSRNFRIDDFVDADKNVKKIASA